MNENIIDTNTAKFIDGAGFEKSFSFYIISLSVFTDETDQNVFNTKAFFWERSKNKPSKWLNPKLSIHRKYFFRTFLELDRAF